MILKGCSALKSVSDFLNVGPGMEQSKSCSRLKNLNNFNTGTTFCTFMDPIPVITPKQHSCIL